MASKLSRAVLMVLVCSVSSATLPPGSKWANKEADIYFLLDSSSSVWAVDYDKLKEFVVSLVSAMDIRASATRVGLGTFSDKHSLHVPLDSNLDKAALSERIKTTPYLKGNTYLSAALKGARTEALAVDVSRASVPHMVVLITDGVAFFKQLAKDNATETKRAGIKIFTVGVGKDVDIEELEDIASDPKNHFSFFVKTFDQLGTIRDSLLDKMADVVLTQADEGACSQNTSLDAVFVYDLKAFGATVSLRIKEFLKNTAKSMRMASRKVRMGVISASCYTSEINLEQYLTGDTFVNGLDSVPEPGVSTLLKRARISAFSSENGGRTYATKRIVLIVDKHFHEDERNVIDEILRARYLSNIEIFIIFIGDGYNKRLLEMMASRPSYITYIEDSTNLPLSSEFRKEFCKDL